MQANLTGELNCCSVALDVRNQPHHIQTVTPRELEKRDQAAPCVIASLPCGIHCGTPNAKMKSTVLCAMALRAFSLSLTTTYRVAKIPHFIDYRK